MQFLKTALLVVLAAALALFCKANWITVPVKLWGDLVADTKLPVLVLGAFLAGALPFWAIGRATRWRMRRRIDAAERALTSATSAPSPQPAQTAAAPDTPSLSAATEARSDTEAS